MPSKSKNQRVAAAIAEHAPSKLYKRNKGLKKMSKSKLRKYAETKEGGLPKKKGNPKKKKSGPNEDFVEFINRREKKIKKGKR